MSTRRIDILLLFLLILSPVFSQLFDDKNYWRLKWKKGFKEVQNDTDASPTPKTWAVLVAGSNTWYNYRHQADVFHAYQILKAHKIPDENIIMMFYDDIAYSSANPTRGIVINRPDGKNVYKNIPKDYTGDTVTPANFINILTGNEKAMKGIGSGKVLKSTKYDRVFINFVDHGGPGVLCFPEEDLTVGELQAVLQRLHKENKYAEMVLYIEACESGSMFRKVLPNNWNIFVTTAASYNESSYACYYDGDRSTFLGDCYSVDWMEDTDQRDISHETLYDQYLLVKKETNLSHVQEYGDLRVAKLPVADFQGEGPAEKIQYPKVERSPVPSHDVPLHIFLRKLASSKNSKETAKLHQDFKLFLNKRKYLEKIVRAIAYEIASKNESKMNEWLDPKTLDLILDFECHTEIVHAFSRICFNFGKSPYALRFAHVLANMCNDRVPVHKAIKFFGSFCSHLVHKDGIH